jgi:hypothetical protein
MDCASVMNISYCVCENCSFAFRLNNAHYLDGGLPDEESVKLQRAVETELQKLVDVDPDIEKMPLSEYIAQLHKCIRCGSLAITRENDLYTCAGCGFSWEAV